MRRIILALLIAALTPTIGHAWGSKGHKVVAALSLEYLSDGARAGVQSLLGPDDAKYTNAAVWADQIRNDRPKTKRWLLVDFPKNAAGYDPARDCKNQNCAVAQIDVFAKQLADPKASKTKRIEALKFVIHFVGDIHQPMHGAEDDDDQGGNLVFVTIDGTTDKLHSVWDTFLVNKLGASPDEIAENLESRISDADVKKFMSGTPKSWAEESHKIAHDFIYAQSKGKEHDEDNPVVLPNDYLAKALPIVRSRLSLAAVRLAMVINKSFEKQKPQPKPKAKPKGKKR
jgi:hypothetical protein